VYTQGGHSKSYAEFQVPALAAAIAKGTVITGTSVSGAPVAGTAMDDYEVGDRTIAVVYETSAIQASYVGCQAGGLQSPVTAGCFATTEPIIVQGGATMTASRVTHKNGRTLQGFSTNAQGKMYDGCPGCPYKDYLMFYDYYGTFDYANQWVVAALEGRDFTNRGLVQRFSSVDAIGRVEAAAKGSAYMAVWMYVVREFEDAIDDCVSGCLTCNDAPVHAWDEGVAFYTGSLEGTDGAGSGVMPYALADKRCANFKTCGTLSHVYNREDGITTGPSQVRRVDRGPSQSMSCRLSPFPTSMRDCVRVYGRCTPA
jgi:hypothetical protein